MIIALLFQWIESEMSRLSNLRDRASEKGRRKEYPLLFICIDKENMIERGSEESMVIRFLYVQHES